MQADREAAAGYVAREPAGREFLALPDVRAHPLLVGGEGASEWNLRVLGELGFDDETTFHLHLSLFSFVHGSASSLEAEHREEADTGLTGDDRRKQREDAARSTLGSGAFPVSERVFGAPGLRLDLDALFEFGLARLLDGFERFAGLGARSAVED